MSSSPIEVGAPATLGEITSKAKRSSIGAAELKEQKAAKNKGAAIAKQRAGNRAKGNDGIYAVDRTAGTDRPQDEKSIHVVDRGPPTVWRRAYSLPSFPDPPGYTYCYIARHKRRQGDDANLLASLREGWQFVKPGELDEEDVPTESFTGRLAKHGEVVGDDTTILMKMPDALKAQRDAYYNRRRDLATREVRKRNPGLAEANPKMPLVEDRNEVSEENVTMRARRAPQREAET